MTRPANIATLLNNGYRFIFLSAVAIESLCGKSTTGAVPLAGA
jgi:hypothetical protein